MQCPCRVPSFNTKVPPDRGVWGGGESVVAGLASAVAADGPGRPQQVQGLTDSHAKAFSLVTERTIFMRPYSAVDILKQM